MWLEKCYYHGMNEKKIENIENPTSAISKAEVGAYALSAATGGYAFCESVNKQTYDLIKKSDLLGTDIKQYLANRSANVDRNHLATSFEKFHKQFAKLEHTQFKALGIDSIWQRLKCLHHDQKIEAAVHGATVGGIIAVALGGALSFVENRKLAKQVNEQITKNNQESQSQAL